MNLTLFFLFIAYMASPKISIFDVGEAQIRPEDFISLCAVLVFIFKGTFRSYVLPKYLKIYLLFVAINFASALFNVGANGAIGFVYAARYLQYLIWFFIFMDIGSSLSRKTLFVGFLCLSGFLSAWGYLEFFGLIEKIGRLANVEDRLSLNTSGPFEASCVLIILAYSLRSVLVSSNLVFLAFLTQARISLAAGILSLFRKMSLRSFLLISFAALALLTVQKPIRAAFEQTRFAEAQGADDMLASLATSFAKAPVLTPKQYSARFLEGNFFGQMAKYVDIGGDGTSFNIRAIRWATVIKSTAYNPVKIFIGWGPGAWSLALDGYYVRLFGEVGLIGMFVFLMFVVLALRTIEVDSVASYSLVLLLIVAIFIDIFTSSKVVPLLWCYLALTSSGHKFAR